MTRPGGALGRLIQFLIELAQERGFAKITLTIQGGQIEMVHVDRSYKIGELPLKDPGRPGISG
jgi:hypothetical protein